MNTEKFFEGPGSSDMVTYIWEIALILGIAFLLGYLLRYFLNDVLKNRIADLESENAKLYNASKDAEQSASDIEQLEIKQGEQKAEIDRLNAKLSECYTTRLKAENQVVDLQAKYDAISSAAPASDESKGTPVEVKETTPVPVLTDAIVTAISGPVSTKDDLKKIGGVGPKIQELLNADGILSYDDVATATVARIKGILITAGPNYAVHDPTTWGEQATLASAEKWEALSKLQAELKGEKRR
ncbi:hypothetical protein N9772_01455 [Bacteroidia bacterium]|nr:hypothetical protein [Bacteroidia bacterium]